MLVSGCQRSVSCYWRQFAPLTFVGQRLVQLLAFLLQLAGEFLVALLLSVQFVLEVTHAGQVLRAGPPLFLLVRIHQGGVELGCGGMGAGRKQGKEALQGREVDGDENTK